MKSLFVIGSRGSKLALIQAQLVQTALQNLNPSLEVNVEIVKTSGDVNTDPLSVIGGKGVFTRELEDALLDGRIDIAVHSLKDLPTFVPDALLLAAICKREDPRDALVLREDSNSSILKADIAINEFLARGATVGTSSARRLAQLKYLRSDLVFREVRGNVDTRLRKLDEGQYDALLLACAGLRRLGLEKRISVPLSIDQMLPAAGQGALAVEARADDAATIATVSKLDHKFTRLACLAERAFLRNFGGGCQLPIAAYAVVREKQIRLTGLVADARGKHVIRDRLSAPIDEAEDLGSRLADRLMANGASELLAHS